jgi:O-antigen/teichoic acid export membrane protein
MAPDPDAVTAGPMPTPAPPSRTGAERPLLRRARLLLGLLVLSHGLWLGVVALETGLFDRIFAFTTPAFWSGDLLALAVPFVAAAVAFLGLSLLATTVAQGRNAARVTALAINALACGIALSDTSDPLAAAAVATSAIMVGLLAAHPAAVRG